MTTPILNFAEGKVIISYMLSILIAATIRIIPLLLKTYDIIKTLGAQIQR
jgi:hypothetical protein